MRIADRIGRAADVFLRTAFAMALAAGILRAAPVIADEANSAPPVVLSKNTLSVSGQDRDYYYYVPANVDRDGFNQIVYALHDNGETAQQFAGDSGWTKVADRNGFVVVFPESAGKEWGPSAGGEDDYLKSVLAHASTHMVLPQQGGPGGPAGEGGGRQGGPPRVRTWAPFQYLTGVGAGASLAQSFAMNHPGLYAALATIGGAAFDEAYAKGEEPSEAAFLHLWSGKALTPVWKQHKKNVPVAVWLFSAGEPGGREIQQAEYWKAADAVAAAATTAKFSGLQTTVYAAPGKAAQQVRTTMLPPSAKFNAGVAGTVWDEFFAHIARWTSYPDGGLDRMLTHAEVNKTFDVRTIAVGDRTYTYYVKVPSGYRKGQSLPVVLSAHGFGFPAWLYLSQIKLHEVGEKEGFITVYVQGQRNAWNFDDPEGPDSQYVQKVIAAVEADYGTDPARVYMQGFSFGSGLTYMMGLTHPQLFAAVSPNSGIGPMPPDVEARIAAVKATSDIRIPMIMVYGTADRGGTIDGELPAKGVLQGAFDEIKAYDHIATRDSTRPFHSSAGPDYSVLVPGGSFAADAVDAQYPDGRFKTFTYASADAVPLDLFKFVWVIDLTHGGDPREAQIEWNYFKHWRRNADGTLTYTK
jgi:poly(3-hydroxybutyrate) depolymerase